MPSGQLQAALEDERLEQFYDVLGEAPDVGAVRAGVAGIERPDIAGLTKQARTVSEGAVSPLRSQLEEQVGGYLGGETPISDIPLYGSGRATLEAQIGKAREGARGRLGRGGALESTLTDIDIGRARGLGDLESQLFQQMYGTGTELAKLKSGEFSSSLASLTGLAGQTYGADVQAQLGIGELEADIFGTKTRGAGTLASSLADVYSNIGAGQGFGEGVAGGGGFGGSTINPEVLSGFTNEPSIFGAGYWEGGGNVQAPSTFYAS